MRRLVAVCVFVPGLLAGGCARPAPPSPTATSVDVALRPDTELVRGRVPANVTLDQLLRDLRTRGDLIPSVIAVTRPVFDPRRLRADQPYRLVRTAEGDLRSFEYEIDVDRFLRVAPGAWSLDSPLTATVVSYRKERAIVAVTGAITPDTPSLFEAMDRAGERPDLSVDLADVFSGDVDFNSDLQPGDRFNVAFEKVYREEGFAGYGVILAAELVNDGRCLRAVRFTPPGGKPGYYDERGRSLKRFLLKSPLKFAPRVTSRFTGRRFHPVLRIYRAHFGVDYAAPVGAPVISAANGVVTQAGLLGDGGRTVQIRHPNSYETVYMHLSSIAPGIRPGARVDQGQLIGRVGTSGLSSGPHLDFRIRKRGAYVNPLTEHKKLPPGEPIAREHMAAFEAARDRVLARLVGPANGASVPGGLSAPPSTARPTSTAPAGRQR